MSYTTWNPDDKNANITLSNENRTATAANASHKIVRATIGRRSTDYGVGKYYFEVYINTSVGTAVGYRCMGGVATFLANLNSFLGNDAYGWSFSADGYKRHAGASANLAVTSTTGDTLCYAVDLVAGKLWAAKNGVWLASGDPAAGTNELFQDNDLINYKIYPTGGAYGTGNVFTLYTNNNQFSFVVPAGFDQWDPSDYYFDGYVYEVNEPVNRIVRAYNRDNGEFVGYTTSSGVGGYYFLATTYSGAHYVVCLDDNEGESYNALITDNIIPTLIA